VTTNSTVWELNVRSNTADDMTVRIDPGAILTTFSGINIEDGGRLQLSGGRVDAQFVEVLGGALTGTGTIEIGNGPIIGQVEVRGGLIAPGNGLGTLTVSGNFSANSSSTFQFELGGNTPGTGYDRLVVDYDMSIDGTLEVLLRPGFSPRVGDAFTLISTGGTLGGNFDEWVFPAGYTWNVNLQPSSVILSVTGARSPGDVNSDGRVDGLDIGILFGAWGNSSGSADVTRDGIVDGADIALVFSHWTGEAGPVVPEPSWGPVLSLALGIDARRAGRRIA